MVLIGHDIRSLPVWGDWQLCTNSQRQQCGRFGKVGIVHSHLEWRPAGHEVQVPAENETREDMEFKAAPREDGAL